MRPHRAHEWRLLAFILALWAGASPLFAGTRFLILCGSGGEEGYRQKFSDWGTRLRGVLVQQFDYPEDSIQLLMEPQPDLSGQPGKASDIKLETIQSAMDALAKGSTAEDDVCVILIGHGSYLRREAKFNIPGPDLLLSEFSARLDAVHARRIVVINSTSTSAAFINELSGPGRIIVTATKSVNETNATSFMEFFIQGLHDGSADQNRDERISLLEACRQASSLTEAWYLGKGITPTEHAILDDNGDGLGSRALGLGEKTAGEGGPVKNPAEQEDGAAADVFFLKDFSFPPSVPRELSDKYLSLLGQIEQLKREKPKLEPGAYGSRLEALLLEAAKVNREIHEAEDKTTEPQP